MFYGKDDLDLHRDYGDFGAIYHQLSRIEKLLEDIKSRLPY
jgi:hypothetical protein